MCMIVGWGGRGGCGGGGGGEVYMERRSLSAELKTRVLLSRLTLRIRLETPRRFQPAVNTALGV